MSDEAGGTGGASGEDEARRALRDKAALDADAAETDESPLRKLGRSAREIDGKEGLVKAARKVRKQLPGDTSVGDPLSLTENRPSDLVARMLTEDAERESASRELGLAAIQVLRSFSDSRQASRGERAVVILFTDLVEFSAWALRAGDEAAVRLLQEVAAVVEPAIRQHDGRVVKRLGDGYMAAFGTPDQAVRAALDAQQGISTIAVDGHTPRLRAGIHLGHPRKVSADYLGVDVNIAARICDAAGDGQVLVSDAAAEDLDPEAFSLRRKRFRAKGAPKDLKVMSVRAR